MFYSFERDLYPIGINIRKKKRFKGEIKYFLNFKNIIVVYLLEGENFYKRVAELKMII